MGWTGAGRRILKYWEPLKFESDLDAVRLRRRRERRILTLLDGIGFSWRVYAVAFLGFLASSWSLIAINIISPALYFIYPPADRVGADAGLVLDMMTLIATVIGMVVFGHLADRLGRSALYGFEIFIVLSAIGGAAFASEGYIINSDDGGPHRSSMDIYASLFWWRFVLGIGIGAEYPMSAVIAAEFASSASRGSMLAGVFLAQSVGRLLAYGLGLGVLRGYVNSQSLMTTENQAEEKLVIDVVWRLVLGLAGVPAVFAIGLRFFIPETPRFYSAIRRDMKKAKEVVARIGSRSPRLSSDNEFNPEPEESVPTDRIPWGTAAWAYFFGKTQGWKRLAFISFQWLLLDIAFYGTGLDSPGTLSALWMNSPGSKEEPEGFGVWKEDHAKPHANIYETIDDNSTRTLELTSIAAIVASLAVIPLVNVVSRKALYISTTTILAFVFVAMAISVSQTYAKPEHYVSMVFYSLAQFMFNLGPNTLTFMLAVEMFPTEFRGTCYGIAAASGKIGAIIVRPIIERVGKGRDGLTIMLSIFAVILFFNAFIAWLEPWGLGIPQVQEPREPPLEPRGFWASLVPTRLKNKSLEEISIWPAIERRAGTESPPEASQTLDFLEMQDRRHAIARKPTATEAVSHEGLVN